MYRMLYNDSFLFDPFDETRIVSSASITTNVNAASYLDFTIAANHPLYSEIEQRSGIITLYSDNETLFQGQITSIDMDMDGNKSVTCSSALDWLRDVQLRPYSTDQAECDEYEFKLDKAPDALDAYFQWLIDQYNAQNKDGRYFTINVNQAADLTNRNIVYFSSTSPRSVADAIEQDILGTFGGYLVLRYEDNQLILDLYSDIHEMNEQIIDYGENILDISRTESTDDQYTAVYPIGATPQYTAEQQKYHDEKDAYDERMKQREETEKAAINQLKKEEEAEQKRIDGMGKGDAKKNAQNALKRRKEQRQAREKAFSDETKRLQDEQKIKDDKNAADKTKPNPITIESLDNGGYEGDLDIFKEGDVVYSVSYVQRYGYKEFVYSDTDVDDKQLLLKLAVAKLKTLMAPVLTIDVRAVDQALYNPKHTHLFAGQAVRVRSKAHNVDEFMMVSSIDLDLIDPSQTTATLGVAYDTLTGQQSSFLRNLNSQIVASVDAVDKLGEDVKVTEITLGRVETVVDNVAADNELIVNTVGDYKWMTDTAWGKAEDAQESADEANQGVTDTNVRIDNLKLATDERIDDMVTDISGIHDSINDTKAEIVTIKENAEQIRQDAQAGIDEAKQQAEDIRTEANTAIDTVKTDLAATEAKAQQAASNASAALGGLSSTNANLNTLATKVDRNTEQITNAAGEIVGVKDTISGVAETANSALTVATTNTQAINEQSTRIDTAYSDIEATRTSVSEVKQTADGLKVNLETNYLDKTEIGNAYASKAELSATSESITSTVEKTYATKSALEGLQNIADAAIETWSGRVVPTASNAPASTWTTDALKRQHSGDIYYDMTTGKSYRWGSEDGKVYSWSMIADSDITKAIADAAKAQQTADGAKQDVVNLSNDVKATYTSKSEFKQTSDEIKASVSEVASANEVNTQKIAEVSVKADGISAKLKEQAETISGHTTTIGQLSLKADGLQTKFEQVSDDLTELTDNLDGLINPSFSTNSMYGWTIRPTDKARMSSYDRKPGGPYLVIDSSNAIFLATIINDGILTFAPKHRYRVTVMMKVTHAEYFSSSEGITIRLAKPNYTNMIDWVDGFYANVPKSEVGTAWKSYSKDIVIGEYGATGHLRLAFRPTANAGASFALKSVKIEDITEAQTALVKTSELQQNLDGFKQTVSETYTTKDEFDNLQIGGRNLLLKTKTSKQVVGNNGTNQCMTLYTLSTHSWAHLDPGEYMISADISYEGTISGKFAFQRDYKPWGFTPSASKNFADIITDSKRKAHVEFCVTNAYVGAHKGLAVRFDNVQGTVTFSNIKLEKGNKATTWSPAPEDLLDTATASTTYTTKSEFTQTANEIKGTVAEQATTIAGHTNTIGTLSLKADKFETDISQVTEQATAIAGRTTKLEQNLDGFKQTVSGTYITKTDAEQNLVDAINGMQIGGTNMLLDTRAFGSANPNGIPAHGFTLNSAAQNGTYNQFTYRRIPDTVTTNNPDGPAYNNISIERGKTYTASFYYRGTADLFVYFYGPSGYVGCVATTASNGTTNNSVNGNVTFTKDSEWKRYWVTWTLHKTGGSNLKKHLLFRRKGTAGYIDIAGVKLEEGNKATEWSPSPFDTLYASTITSTYAPKTMVEQTEDRITQTVEATYATKTQLSDEMKQSLKTFELRGRMDGNYWLKMGRVTMAQQGKDFHIDYTGGRGFNGDTGQNSQLEIHVRSSNGGGRLFAVTLNRLLNADMYQIKAFTIDATHIDLYIKSGSRYTSGTMAYYGQYSDFSGAAQIDDISTAEGTELTVLEQSLSTKTYVQQTAESVSIGVVEDFKDGLHGDKLTTQSNLTALKNEITASVSEQYADLSDRINLVGSENVVGKNFSFENNNFDGWASHDRWAIGTNGAHTGRYYAQNTIPANSNGNQLISTGSIAAEYGHTYKLEYWVKKKKPNTRCRGAHRISYKRSGVWENMPSDVGTTMFLDEEGKTNINVGANGGLFAVTDSWTKVTVYIIPPSNVTELRVRIIGNNPGSAETVFAVDDVSLTDYSVAKTINKTMAGIDIKADSIVQEVRNDYATKDLVNRSIPGLKNPNFDVQKNGDYHTIAGWSSNGPWTEVRLGNSDPVSSSEGGTYFIGKSGTTAGQTLELINQGYISAYPGMKVQISWWMFVDSHIIKDSNFSAGIIANNVVTRNLLSNYSTGGWKYMTTTVTVPANVNQFRVRFGFVTTGTSGWLRLDSVSVTDVTEANAAMGRANTAVSTLEEFKRTVSNTYVSNDKLTEVQTQWKQTTDGFAASIKKTEKDISAVGGSMTVINGNFETHDTTGWAVSHFKNTSVTNGSIYQNRSYRFLGYRNGNNRPTLRNEGTVTARKGDFVKVSARILLLDSTNTSIGGSMRIGVRNSHSGVPYLGNMTIMAGGWNTVSYNAQIPEDGTYGLLMDFPNNIAESTKILVDDVIMSNETEAIHADTRINALETRIAMTSNGVRVGKIVNDKFQGGNVLMNANDGSFDILNGDEVRNRFTSESIDMVRNSNGQYQYRIIPFTQSSTGSAARTIQGVNMVSLGYFALNGIPATPSTYTVYVDSGNGKLPSDGVLSWQLAGLGTAGAKALNAKVYHDQFYANMDAGRVPAPEVFEYPIFAVSVSDGESTCSKREVMITAPAMYVIQGQWNAQKPSANALCDVSLIRRKYNETNYTQVGGSYRFSENSDPTGWTTKGGPIWSVKLDAGDRIAFKMTFANGRYTIGGGNWFSITRLPFSGQDMR